MTVKKLSEILNAREINIADGGREITSGYAGDLLSFVMGRAPSDSAWFTVMTNINICAVAALADVAVVVVCEGSVLNDEVIAKAKGQDINILVTDYDIFGSIERYLNEDKVRPSFA